MTVTLKAIHLVNEGSYIVTRGYNTIEVDGISVETSTFTVSDLSTILHVHTPTRQITHYVNDLGDTMSDETFKEQKSILASKGTEDNEWPGEYLFADLDDEYAFKLFCRTWKPVYNEPGVEKNPVTIELTEVRTNSGDPDIQSMWNSPGMNNNSHLYILNRLAFTVKEFKSCCESRELTPFIPSHSGIKYVQIEGHYLNFEDMDYSRLGASFIGTLEQCKVEKERLQNRIQTEVSLFIVKYKTKVGLNNAGEVLNNLYHIRNLVTKISPKSASYSAHRSAIGKINELVESIRKDMLAQAPNN
jgi:hypothetical protein